MNEHDVDTGDTLNKVRSQVHEFESLIESLDGALQKLVAEKPMLVLGGTLLAGFVAGRILSRK